MSETLKDIHLPGGTLPAIAEADTELAAQVEERKADKRAQTSAKNGEKGGRPYIPVDEWANDFAQLYCTQNGIYTLRNYKGEWYEYKDGRYCELHESDLKMKLTGALQKRTIGYPTRISNAIIKDIALNLQSENLCGLPSDKYHMPCFISNTESARGFMPMKNTILDIEAAAKALNNGQTLEEIQPQEKTPDLFITYGLDYDFVPGAKCPKFLKYLEEVQPNEENRECLQMLMGLSLIPDCSYNVAFFLYGVPGGGKTVFTNVLTALVGSENTCSVPLAKFGDRFGTAPLTEKLLNIVSELPVTPENGRTGEIEGIFKAVTSGDTIPVERKGIDGWEAPAIARIVFSTNNLPTIIDRSGAVFDRMRIIPFNQRFRDTDKQNLNLTEELFEELPGILNFAIEGLAKLRQHRSFPHCQDGKKILKQLQGDCDHERTFLQETVLERNGAHISTELLFEKYKNWMLNNGYRALGMGNFQNAVKRIYTDVYIERERTESGRKNFFFNIALQP